MKKKIFIIIFAAFAALCFLNTENANTKDVTCENGYVKTNTDLCHNKWGHRVVLCCYNPKTHLSYDDNSIFYFDGESCGSYCNNDGTGCKYGTCNVKECKIGYTEIKDGMCYNPVSHLSYYNNWLYLNSVHCGTNCNDDGTICKKGNCNEKEIKAYGYTEIKDGKFYNPKTHLSFTDYNFYLDNAECGYGCNLDGTNCKGGYCDKNELTKYGFTEIKDGKFYNPKTNLSFTEKSFYINGKSCGYGCNLDGTNCEEGMCNKKICDKNKGYELIGSSCYNSLTHLSYDDKKYFYLDNFVCGYDCDLDGKNCKKGFCDIIKKHGYTETKPYNYNYKYCPWCSDKKDKLMYNRFYNPKTHISVNCSFKDTHNDCYYYLDDIACGYNKDLNGIDCKEGICGYNCDLDGKNCEKGVCVADACENGYKNLGILTISYVGGTGFFPGIEHMESVVCYNNSKYYNVFEPNIKKSVVLKDIKRVNN